MMTATHHFRTGLATGAALVLGLSAFAAGALAVPSATLSRRLVQDATIPTETTTTGKQ